MTPKRAACFIALVWICSSLVSFPTIAWWRAVAASNSSSSASSFDFNQQIHPMMPEQCVYTDDIGYLVFSSIVSFYVPLSVMVFTYYRIYRAAVAQSRSLRLGTKKVVMNYATDELIKGTTGRGSSESESAEMVKPLTLRLHRGGRKASESRRCAAVAAILTYEIANRQHSFVLKQSTFKTITNIDNVLQIPDPSFHSKRTIDRRHSSPETGTITTPKTIFSVTSSADVASDSESGRFIPIAKLNVFRKLSKIVKERKAAK
jgi:hypothetical protein